MQMFDQIYQHDDLRGISEGSCEENTICIGFCNLLKNGDEIDDEKVKILKIDKYYQSKKMHNPPPSIDCLIIVSLGNNKFDFYLIELRKVKGTKRLEPNDIVPKFETTVERFLTNDFADIFLSPNIAINQFKLWLVSNYGKSLTEEQYKKKIQVTVLDRFQGEKPLRFRNKIAMIEPKRNNPEICI